MRFVVAWLRQPSSVAGVAAVLGTVSGLLAGQVTVSQAVPLLVGAAASILLPDNTQAVTTVRAAAQAIVDATKPRGA